MKPSTTSSSKTSISSPGCQLYKALARPAGSKLVALGALLAALGCTGPKQEDNPRVELSPGGFLLHLPTAMQQALQTAAPGFRSVPTVSFRSDVSQAAAESGGGLQPLFAVIEDLDGDGSTDAVVEGTATGDSSLVVIAILNRKQPVAMEVTRFATYDADAVGIYLSKPATGGAFNVVNYPDATTTWTYRDGKFVAQ